MHSAVFDPTISVVKGMQTYVLDHTASGIISVIP